MMDKIKIMIADDQELIRESLSIVLNANADMEVTGLAGNGRELIELDALYIWSTMHGLAGVMNVQCVEMLKLKAGMK